MKKLVLAYSGGLDTSYCLKKLSNFNHIYSYLDKCISYRSMTEALTINI